ncbi:uncharacterized protein LOC123703010 [Colias croceus]|uniref:uncharacterized protein LOC123703010 n=1 Tax=Colias crocea TaxID=72248 RepID=UPI001E2803C5|nr:uncharacterized protein LOC123703010 [Colias croceus]
MGASCSCNETWCNYMMSMRDAAKRRRISRQKSLGRRPKCLRIRRKLPDCKCLPTPEKPSCPELSNDNYERNTKPCAKHVTFTCPDKDTKTECVCSSVSSYRHRSIQCPETCLSDVRLEPACNCFVRNNVCRFTVDAYFN